MTQPAQQHKQHVHRSLSEKAPAHNGKRRGDQWITAGGVVYEWTGVSWQTRG
jgi:hypothetical protein